MLFTVDRSTEQMCICVMQQNGQTRRYDSTSILRRRVAVEGVKRVPVVVEFDGLGKWKVERRVVLVGPARLSAVQTAARLRRRHRDAIVAFTAKLFHDPQKLRVLTHHMHAATS